MISIVIYSYSQESESENMHNIIINYNTNNYNTGQNVFKCYLYIIVYDRNVNNCFSYLV